MKSRYFTILFLSCALYTVTGCFTNHERPNMALGGMVAGAAAGAIVGGTTNLGTGNSMLVGAGAGLLTGAILDVYASDFQSALEDNDAVIQQNADTISMRQIQLDQLREDVKIETADTVIDTSENNYLYVGPSLGSYTR